MSPTGRAARSLSSQSMAKSSSGRTEPSFGGRSRIWPTEAITVKSLPRYLLIVFALAGDSTITIFCDTLFLLQTTAPKGADNWHYRVPPSIEMGEDIEI